MREMKIKKHSQANFMILPALMTNDIKDSVVHQSC